MTAGGAVAGGGGGRHGGRRRRWAGRFAAAGVTLAAALGVLAGAVHIVGLPDVLVRHARAEARRAGFHFDARRFRIDWRHGLVAEDVRFVAGIGGRHVLAEARFVVVRVARSAWRREGILLRGFRAYDAALELETAAEGQPEPVRHRLARGMRVEGTFTPEGLRIRAADAAVLGLRADADGLLLGVEPPRRAVARPRPPARRWTVPEGAAAAVRQAEALLASGKWATPPRLHLGFRLDPSRAESTAEASVVFEGRDGVWRGLSVNTVEAAADWTPGGLRLERLHVQAHPLRLSASGAWDRATDRVDARVEGEGPYALWRRFPLPAAVESVLDAAEIEGAAHLRFSAEAVDAPRTDPWARFEGRLDVADLTLRRMALERASCRYLWDRPFLRLREIEGRVGRGRGAGPASGEADFDFSRDFFTLRGEAAFDPQTLMPLLLPEQARYVGALRWQGAPPEATFTVEGHWGRRHALTLRARGSASDMVFNGSRVDHVEADVLLDGGTLVFERLIAHRPEGRFEGTVRQDMVTDRVTFDVVSDMHPHAVGRMISPEAHRLAQRFRFEGPVRVRARGWADTRPDGVMGFTAEVEGEGIGMNRFLAERGRFDVVAEGRTVRLRHIRGVYAGGGVAGELMLRIPDRAGGPMPYAVALRAAGVDLAELASDFARDDLDAYQGRVEASLRLRGRMGEGEGPGARGVGRLRIRGEGLLRIPIFGGLSTWLSRIYPGFGFVSQDDLQALFRIADSRVRVDPFTLEGDVLSVTGQGNIRFDTTVSGRVQVRLLRRGVVADVLRFVTSPVSRLLEFELSGTLDDPRWRPRNLPIE